MWVLPSVAGACWWRSIGDDNFWWRLGVLWSLQNSSENRGMYTDHQKVLHVYYTYIITNMYTHIDPQCSYFLAHHACESCVHHCMDRISLYMHIEMETYCKCLSASTVYADWKGSSGVAEKSVHDKSLEGLKFVKLSNLPLHLLVQLHMIWFMRRWQPLGQRPLSHFQRKNFGFCCGCRGHFLSRYRCLAWPWGYLGGMHYFIWFGHLSMNLLARVSAGYDKYDASHGPADCKLWPKPYLRWHPWRPKSYSKFMIETF